jgi:hypothetical protein
MQLPYSAEKVSQVNIPKFIPELANEPLDPFFTPFLPEIEDFSRVFPPLFSPIP